MKRHDASKLWVQDNLNKLAINKALEQIQSTGRALPCKVTAVSGQTVTVSFISQSDTWTLPQVTIPLATSFYDWLPVQIGDMGMTLPSDVSISPISGMGSEPSILGQNPANLSSLVFVPVANASWIPPGGDPNMRVSQGPDGVLVQDLSGAVSGLFSKAKGITLTFGSDTLVMNSSGVTITAGTIILSGNVEVTGNISGGTGGSGTATFNGLISTSGAITSGGNITAGSIDLETHVHTGVTSGGSNTGGPTG